MSVTKTKLWGAQPQRFDMTGTALSRTLKERQGAIEPVLVENLKAFAWTEFDSRGFTDFMLNAVEILVEGQGEPGEPLDELYYSVSYFNSVNWGICISGILVTNDWKILCFHNLEIVENIP